MTRYFNIRAKRGTLKTLNFLTKKFQLVFKISYFIRCILNTYEVELVLFTNLKNN